MISTCLLAFSAVIHKADSGDVSRVTLRKRITAAFVIDESTLLLNASSAVFKRSAGSGSTYPTNISAEVGINKSKKQKGDYPRLIARGVGGQGLSKGLNMCFKNLPHALKISGVPPCSAGASCTRLHDISRVSKKELQDGTVQYGGTYKQAVLDAILKLN